MVLSQVDKLCVTQAMHVAKSIYMCNQFAILLHIPRVSYKFACTYNSGFSLLEKWNLLLVPRLGEKIEGYKSGIRNAENVTSPMENSTGCFEESARR